MAPLDSIGLEARALRIVPAGQVKGVVTAPSSKSVTNRLLVMAALAEGTSTARHPLVSDDTVAMAVGLGCFGARVTLTEEAAVVSGTGGAVEAPAGVVGAGLSGTTLRFLAAVSLLAPGPVTLDGEPPLRRRPLGGLLGALAEAGARVKSADGHAPVVVEPSGFTGGHLVVDAAASSQFASALLLVAPYARSDVQLRVENLGAGGYVEMTVDSMRRWGAAVTRSDEDTFIVTAGRHYLAAERGGRVRRARGGPPVLLGDGSGGRGDGPQRRSDVATRLGHRRSVRPDGSRGVVVAGPWHDGACQDRAAAAGDGGSEDDAGSAPDRGSALRPRAGSRIHRARRRPGPRDGPGRGCSHGSSPSSARTWRRSPTAS